MRSYQALSLAVLCATFTVPVAHAGTKNALSVSAAQSVTPPFFASDMDTLQNFAGDGGAVETLPGGFQVVLSDADALAQATDPFYKRTLNRTVYVYTYRREPKRAGWFLVCAVHHIPEDRDNAARVARLCARLLRLAREQFGHNAVFPRAADTADIWLCPNPAPHSRTAGGETRASHIYVWGTTTGERGDLEWVRTIAHEWGHLTLPAARGFTEPENDAAGLLGERLFVRWLKNEQARLTQIPNDGTNESDLNRYVEWQVTPIAEQFRKGGPTSPLLNRLGSGAMDYYTGVVLAFEDGFGSVLLGRALFSIDGDRAQDLLTSMGEAVAASSAVTVRLPVWMPLPKTNFVLSADAKGAVVLADRPPLPVSPLSRTPLPVRVPGWKWVRPARGSVQTLTLRRAPVVPRKTALALRRPGR